MPSTAWLLAAGLAAAARAQATVDSTDWGTAGVWELVLPSPGSATPPAAAWHHLAAAQGCVYIVGGTGTGANATWQFDVAANAWSQLPGTLPASFAAPGLAITGGLVTLYGGQTAVDGASNTLAVMSLGNVSAGWTSIAIPVGPGPRAGHRLVSWGSIVYMMGGWDQQQYYNDVWGLDLTTYVQSNFTTGWSVVFPNGAPGLPGPRNSFSWDTYSTGIVSFGGFFHNVVSGDPWTQCTSGNDGCIWYNDVWFWRPGPTPANGLLPATSAAGWTQLPATSTTGALPAGRFWHASGVLGDQLYIYGGAQRLGQRVSPRIE